jgi:hypothetical protein
MPTIVQTILLASLISTEDPMFHAWDAVQASRDNARTITVDAYLDDAPATVRNVGVVAS